MARPSIDLKHPFFAPAIKLFRKLALEAVTAAAVHEESVCSIYALNDRTRAVSQIGSGVLFAFDGHTFCFSASHVFDDVGKYQLLIGSGDRLQPMPGDRFSTKQGPSGTHRDDPIDVSVFHITSEVPAEVRARALKLSDLDLTGGADAQGFFVITGFRSTASKSTSRGHSAQLDSYPTVEAPEQYYRQLGLDRTMHVVLAFEDDVLVEGRWQKSPALKGVSGGGIFHVDKIAPNGVNGALSDARLAATVIEQRKRLGQGFQSVAVGTRIGVHLGLIQKYLPELYLEDAAVEESCRQTTK